MSGTKDYLRDTIARVAIGCSSAKVAKRVQGIVPAYDWVDVSSVQITDSTVEFEIHYCGIVGGHRESDTKKHIMRIIAQADAKDSAVGKILWSKNVNWRPRPYEDIKRSVLRSKLSPPRLEGAPGHRDHTRMIRDKLAADGIHVVLG